MGRDTRPDVLPDIAMIEEHMIDMTTLISPTSETARVAIVRQLDADEAMQCPEEKAKQAAPHRAADYNLRAENINRALAIRSQLDRVVEMNQFAELVQFVER